MSTLAAWCELTDPTAGERNELKRSDLCAIAQLKTCFFMKARVKSPGVDVPGAACIPNDLPKGHLKQRACS